MGEVQTLNCTTELPVFIPATGTNLLYLIVAGPMRTSYGPPLVGEVTLINHYTQLACPGRRWGHENYEEGKSLTFLRQQF
jgi:hypothetical protein